VILPSFRAFWVLRGSVSLTLPPLPSVQSVC
jgi:hypothetical protein